MSPVTEFSKLHAASQRQPLSAIAAPFAGKVIDAIWDPALTKAMQHHRVAIAEEGVAASLLIDQGDCQPSSAALESAGSFVGATKSIKQHP